MDGEGGHAGNPWNSEDELELERAAQDRLRPQEGEWGTTSGTHGVLCLVPAAPAAAGGAHSQQAGASAFFVDSMNQALRMINQDCSNKHRLRASGAEGVKHRLDCLIWLLGSLLLKEFRTETFGLVTVSMCKILAIFQGMSGVPALLHGWLTAPDPQKTSQYRRKLDAAFRQAMDHLKKLTGFLLVQDEDSMVSSLATSICPQGEQIVDSTGAVPSVGKRLMKTTPVRMTRLLMELRSKFQDTTFQRKYLALKRKPVPGNQALVDCALEVQSVILPRYGFAGSAEGVVDMRAEVSIHSKTDAVIRKLTRDIHSILNAGTAPPAEVTPKAARAPGAGGPGAIQTLPTLELRVNGLAGTLCTITAQRTWYVRDVKEAVEAATGIPWHEQRLVAGGAELASHLPLGVALPGAGSETLDLILLRRPPQQAEWLEKVGQDGLVLSDAPTLVRADREVALAAVHENGLALELIAEDLQADREIVLTAVQDNWRALEYADVALRSDLEVVRAAMRKSRLAFEHATGAAAADHATALAAVEEDWSLLRHAAEKVRGNREVVLAAVKKDGFALEYAAEALQADLGLVSAALERDCRALRYAAKELRGDRALLLAAVRREGLALQYATAELQADREVVMSALENNWRSFEFASDDLRSNGDVVLFAIAQNGLAFGYAAEELRTELRFVTTALQRSGMALKYAAEEFQKSPDLVLAAVKENGAAFAWGASELTQDKDFILSCVKENFSAFWHVSDRFRHDPDILGTAVAAAGGSYKTLCDGRKLLDDI